MSTNKLKTINSIMDELHDGLDDIYESLVDDDNNTLILIESEMEKLRVLRSNLKNNNEVQ
jgi:hypothetical protein